VEVSPGELCPSEPLEIGGQLHAMIHVSMHVLDLAVIVAYLVGITWFGTRFKKSQRSLKDYFLGGRNAPWWAISFSIVSAETSTLTVIGTPALAFAGNYGFLQDLWVPVRSYRHLDFVPAPVFPRGTVHRL